ncbi:prolipoprotein diacylglyceryltransferase [Rhizobium sp. ERR 922]|uniref:prolipoprotein diacylglyceryl transferase n=1 Tax=unclassified Rhizobium TaxID=2613769 RepID=UPI00119D46D4|nr:MULTISPECIES: prolipoprotein diacylglyceryl transferase family protein [unclassified Rhizobium]TWB45563.1 prolipoprotein diacylglyceryltransferase [Rhizobium sp. ERR 922]TWB88202.1 prolipoprotein diacylglyceryltransferase [Rhizobium sp. ERR 942]
MLIFEYVKKRRQLSYAIWGNSMVDEFFISPVAFRVSNFGIYWYGVSYLVSFVIIFTLQYYSFDRFMLRNISNISRIYKSFTTSTIVIISTFIGGRFFAFAHEGVWSAATSFLERTGGISSIGSVIAVGTAMLLYCRLNKLNYFTELDKIAIAAPFCIFFIRVANFVNSDFPGTTTAFWLGVQDAHGILRHPVSLYEAIAEGLLLGLLLVGISRRTAPTASPGFVAKLFLAGYSSSHFSLNFLRESGPPGHLNTVWLVMAVLAVASIPWRPSQRVGRNAFQNHRAAPSAKLCSFAAQTLLIGWVTAFAVGCGDAPAPHQGEINPISITKTNPSAEPRCPCENSIGAYLSNGSDSQYSVTFSVNTRDTLSGKILDPQTGTIPVPAKSGTTPGTAFMGCTVFAPATSCRFQSEYQIAGYSKIRVNTTSSASIYGAVTSPSLASCVSWCTDSNNPNSNSCLPLGVRYYVGVAPLKKLLDGSTTQGGVVKKADILHTYGIGEEKDNCGRGDVYSKGDLITNEGKTADCSIKSAELPQNIYDKFGIARNEDDPLQMVTGLPKTVEARRKPDISFLGTSEAVVFENMEKAPQISFNSAGGEKLTKEYGGTVSSSASVVVPGIGKQTIIATSNGCIAVDQP